MLINPQINDAIHTPTGSKVALKRVYEKYNPHEEAITRFLSSDHLSKDPRNHSVPLLNILHPPPEEGEDKYCIFVLPWLRRSNTPIFDTFGEAVECIRQLFEVFIFFIKTILRIDLAYNNFMMESSSLFPEGFHPESVLRKPHLSGKAKFFTRTRRPPKYYIIDFGLSRQYDADNVSPQEPIIVGADRSAPEFQNSLQPQIPYLTDIYYAGNLVRREFLEGLPILTGMKGYHGFEFLKPLIDDMVQADPTKRPSMEEVVKRFGDIDLLLFLLNFGSELDPSINHFFHSQDSVKMYKTAHRSLVANADTPFAPPMSPTTADNLEPPKFPSPDDNIVNVVKFHEQNNGNIPMFVYRKESSEDVTQISFGQFIKAARLVLPMVAKVAAPLSGVVVAIIAQLDTLAYNAIELGLIIAGYIPFLMSPRNTPAAIVHLLKSADCHHILTTHGTLKGLMENIQAELKESNLDYALSITEAPSFADLFPELTEGYRSDLNKPIVHTDNYDAPLGAPQDLMWESVALYLHSSGSTGLPKAIKKTHKQVRRAMAVFPSFSSFLEWSPRVRMLGVQLPPFHGMGSAITLMLPLFKCTTVALFPPVVTSPHMLPIAPTPDVTIEHIHGTKSTCTLTIPSFLQTWAEDKHALEVLKEMDSVSFGGGGLSPHAGAILRANGIRLCSVYGGTEIGGIASSSQREEDKDDWEYVEFLDITTPRWIPQGDGTYELQFLTNDVHAPSVENLTDARGYSTSDLFKPHPSKPGLWKIVGRIDDVIVHSSGEKTVPAPIEASLASSPLIQDAIIFGQGFDQPGVLIEPTTAHTFDTSDPVQVAKYRNLVWPAVEKANLLAPSFSRIFKEMILVANKAKPLPRAGKGTLLKKLALQLYKNEIEELYAATADAASAAQIDPPKSWDHNDVSSWIYENVMDITNGKIGSYTESFFDQGMDSLGATILRRRVASGLQTIKGAAGKRAFVSVTQSLIYNYPSVDALTSHILEILGDSAPTQPSKSHVDIVEEMIAKYSFSVQKNHNANSRKDGGTVVLLTGSTGYFGSQILEILLKDSRINKVYALNRPAKNVSILDRHIKRFQEKGLGLSLLESAKLVLLEADYSKDDLGLDSSTYSELSSWVNIIIHTAWKLNFNHPLSSFEPNIRGTYNLIKFSRLGGHAEDIKFIFTSSVGVAQSWPAAAGGAYPNAVMPEAKYAVGKGYGEGKYVTERILANSGINAVSVRLGQITGSSENGAWAISDWVPILLKSSITLGALPSLHGSISWIPTDGAAGCILDLALHEGQYPTALNLVHHNPVSWGTFVVYMKDALEKERQISLALIPFQEWMERLAHAAVTLTGKDIEKLPAMMLHDFFDGLARRDRDSPRTDQTEAFGSPRFSTEEMKVISKSFQELPLLSPQHAQSWVHYWSLAGLFD